MGKFFNPSVSIEEMAAFLDGNLSSSQMLDVALEIQDDPALQKISDMSDSVDESLETYYVNGIDIPSDIDDDDFELPDLDSPLQLGQNVLKLDLHDDDLVACAASVDEESAATDDANDQYECDSNLDDYLLDESKQDDATDDFDTLQSLEDPSLTYLSGDDSDITDDINSDFEQ